MARYTSFIAAALLLALIAAPAAEAASRRELAQARNAPANKSKSSSRGPTGPTGPAGAPGEDGAPGAAGSPGAAGTPGAAGATGPTGPTGATGVGATGPTGANGVAGPTGPTGPAGSAGTVALVGSASTWSGSITVANEANCDLCECPVSQGPTCSACFGNSGPCRCITTVVSSTGTATPSCIVPPSGTIINANNVEVYTYDADLPTLLLSCPSGDVAYVSSNCVAAAPGTTETTGFTPNGNAATCALADPAGGIVYPATITSQSAWCMTTA